jgi:hypothetical protein
VEYGPRKLNFHFHNYQPDLDSNQFGFKIICLSGAGSRSKNISSADPDSTQDPKNVCGNNYLHLYELTLQYKSIIVSAKLSSGGADNYFHTNGGSGSA